MSTEDVTAEIAAVLAEHLPRDRYRDDGEAIGTYCTCGGWTGDYFADGESGPFDAHLADALAGLLAARDRRVRADALRPLDLLFSGGPDTSCRTTYPEGVECVEVPMGDLRDAFRRAYDEADA